MRLGGPARYVLEIERPEELPDAYGFARTYNLPTFALGGGANTIGHDEGFNGVVLINRMRGIEEVIAPDPPAKLNDGDTLHPQRMQPEFGTTFRIMGGENWDDVVAYACKLNLTGIEALSKIPGLSAAAPVQNIGAYGQEIADVLHSIEVYDTAQNAFRTLFKQDLNFAYRQSILNTTEKNRYFVISITIRLHTGMMKRPLYNSIEKYMSEHDLSDYSPAGIRKVVSAIRADKLPDPLKIASSGSFFKNIYLTRAQSEIAMEKGYPVHQGKDGYKINTGWLIEQAGLKGKLLYGMRISDKAPLVLINESAKGYDDLARAREDIVSKVYDMFGYWIEQEPVEIANPDVAPNYNLPPVTPGVTTQ